MILHRVLYEESSYSLLRVSLSFATCITTDDFFLCVQMSSREERGTLRRTCLYKYKVPMLLPSERLFPLQLYNLSYETPQLYVIGIITRFMSIS